MERDSDATAGEAITSSSLRDETNETGDSSQQRTRISSSNSSSISTSTSDSSSSTSSSGHSACSSSSGSVASPPAPKNAPLAPPEVVTPEKQPLLASSCRSEAKTETDDPGAYEDAHSHRWFSSRDEDDASFEGGSGDPRCYLTNAEFATPAATSGEASAAAAEAAPRPPTYHPDCTVIRMEAAATPDGKSNSTSTSTSRLLANSAAAATVMAGTPQPSSTSSPSPPPRVSRSSTTSSLSPVSAAPAGPACQFPTRPVRVRTGAAPPGVYGGPGTAYPSALLKRHLAAFPIVIPDGVDPTVEPADGQDLADLLDAWEAADSAPDARCGVCAGPADRPGGGGFLGYPACACGHLHARCALLCALLSAPDHAECPGCRSTLRVHRAGRVKPSRSAGGPMSESWFTVSMATGLSAAVTLLAVSVALLLALVEPENRGPMSAADQPLLAGLFCLLGAGLLSCFLIGWLLDRYTAAAWELHSSRLQVAYSEGRLAADSERVLAASLMACTFLDYRSAGYPFPKRPSAYVNYFCLRQPVV